MTPVTNLLIHYNMNTSHNLVTITKNGQNFNNILLSWIQMKSKSAYIYDQTG